MWLVRKGPFWLSNPRGPSPYFRSVTGWHGERERARRFTFWESVWQAIRHFALIERE